jgi:hypothetical protein
MDIQTEKLELFKRLLDTNDEAVFQDVKATSLKIMKRMLG